MSAQLGVTRPKNFSTILGVAKELREIVQEYRRDVKDDPQGSEWLKHYDERWRGKFQELADLMLEDKRVASYLSVGDLQDRFRNPWLYADKVLSEFSDDDLEKYLDYFFDQPETYQFFFPHGILNLAEGYEIGLCVVHDFGNLPANLREHLIEDWGFRFERDKPARGPKTKEEYEAAKKREAYFCTDVKALGYEKAVEIATRNANQSLNIIKTVYIIDVKKLVRCYWISKTSIGGYDTESAPRESDWYPYRKVPELEGYAAILSNMVRKEDASELAKRCLSAVDIYGMIERETPLEVRFLLSVISLEGILLSKDDVAQGLGMRLKEKVAILLGDSHFWFVTYLEKGNPTPQECEANRVAARAALAKKVSDMYGKRSGFAHAKNDSEKVTESDYNFASTIFRLSLQRILSLWEKQGIRRITKSDTVDKESLEYFIESLKYSAPLG